MKVIKRASTVFILELNEEEARLLKTMVQNPISEDEGQQCFEFRAKIFNSLDVRI